MDECETPEEFAWYVITHSYGHSPDLDEIANVIRGYHEKQMRESKKRPDNYESLTAEQQWEVDKKLRILDKEGD